MGGSEERVKAGSSSYEDISHMQLLCGSVLDMSVSGSETVHAAVPVTEVTISLTSLISRWFPM